VISPPRLSDLRAGTQLVAGPGYSTILPGLDFETYSEAGYVWTGDGWACLPRASQGKKGITVVGAARYAEHPSTEVLCLGYDLKDGRGRRMWTPDQMPPLDLFLHIRNGGLLQAWNVFFERSIWRHVCVARMGWPDVPDDQWRCAMAKARAHALPGALENAGAVLGTNAQKDKAGKKLISLYCAPQKPQGYFGTLSWRLPPKPELYDYCGQDVDTEGEIASLVPDLIPSELEYWQADQDINLRGVAIDTVSVNACIAIIEEVLAVAGRELAAITAGAVNAPSEIARLSAWLATQGVHLDSLDEEHIDAALETTMPPLARRALEIRQLAGSASVKKVFAIANQACADGRLRDLYTYHGARTGRPTGNGPQPTNLPSGGPSVCECLTCRKHFGKSKDACPWCGERVAVRHVEWNPSAVEDALTVLRGGNRALAEMYFDDAMPTIAGCLRGMLVAAEGHDLISSDYSAIEAVVIAELAGETWRQEVFRTHGQIYLASAAAISGVSLDEMLAHKKETGSHHPLRKKGKVMELALAYGGWIGAMVAFGADEFMTEQEMKDAAGAWRRASPAIVEFWGGQTRDWRPEMFGVEGAAICAVLSPGEEYSYRGLRFRVIADVLYLWLLSGRPLTYHRPRLRPSDRRPGEWALSYEGWNSNPKNGPMGWIRMDTYGPKIVENLTQATAADIQRHSILKQQVAGYKIVLHTYDENTAEVPEGWGSVEEFEALMNEMPPWAAGWPIKAAGGWRGKRYRKD
jgi:DNA polymerase